MSYSTSPLYTNKSHMLTPEPNSPMQLRTRTLTFSTSRSCIAFLFKFFIFAVFLFTIALFPSQPPDFVNQTIFDKFWELLHLLFVGIAVSYGIFSCRTVVHVNIDHHHHDGSQSFESRMDDALPLFEDGHENPCWDDDAEFKNESLNLRRSRFQDECHTWSSQYFPGESVVVVAQGNSCPEDLAHKPLGLPVRSLRFTSNSNSSEVKGMRNTSTTFFACENESFCQNNETNVGEEVDVCDSRISSIGYQSLGLPVRKLRASTRSTDSYEVSSGGESSSSRKSYSHSFSDGNREKLEDVVNLEEKSSGWDSINSTIGCESYRLPVRSLRGTDSPRYSSGSSESGLSLRCSSIGSERSKDVEFSEIDMEKVNSGNNLPGSSPFPRQLSSGRWRKLRGEDRDFVGPHSHFRPLSVDESQFESFKSQFFGYLASDSSQGSSISYPPTKQSHFSSISSEVLDMKMKEPKTQRLPVSSLDSPVPSKQVNGEELGRKTSFHRQYTWASRYRTDSLDSKASPNAANFKRYNKNEALSNANVQENIEHDLQDMDHSQGEDLLGNKEQYINHSLNLYGTLDEASSDSPSTTEHVDDEALVKWRTFHSPPAVSSSPPNLSFNKVSASRSSVKGAAFGEDTHKSFKEDPEDSNRSRKEKFMTKKEQYMDSLSYSKTRSLTRASLPRAKSVRTRRSKRYVAETSNAGDMSENKTDNMAGKVNTGVQDMYPEENGITTGEVENKKPVVKEASSRDHDKVKQNSTKKHGLEPDDKMETEGANIPASSEGEGRGSNVGNAGEDYSSEVDKKAGEFIAKFREQIRLQKMSSIGDSGELQVGGKYF